VSALNDTLLTDLFCRLASIPSPSGSEGACADAVTIELTTLGLMSALNVVPDEGEVQLEIRSLDDALGREVLHQVTTTLTESAERGGCTIDLDIENATTAYRVPADSEAVRLASIAIERVGRASHPFETRGGSDANVLVSAASTA
jgi:acetylornithine deacetylase/succinyl-diaminopimelate desuccinylase-like protein